MDRHHRPEQARNVKFDAYLAYLQGRALLEHWRRHRPAIERFSATIDQASLCYAQLARAQFQSTFLEGKYDPLTLPRAKALSKRRWRRWQPRRSLRHARSMPNATLPPPGRLSQGFSSVQLRRRLHQLCRGIEQLGSAPERK